MNNIEHDGMNMLDEMEWVIGEDWYQDLPIGENAENGAAGKIGTLRSIKNGRLKEALDTLFGLDYSLELKSEMRATAIEQSGKPPRR